MRGPGDPKGLRTNPVPQERVKEGQGDSRRILGLSQVNILVSGMHRIHWKWGLKGSCNADWTMKIERHTSSEQARETPKKGGGLGMTQRREN